MVTQSVRKSKSDGRNYQCKKKEAGMTSHDVVFKLRKILGTKKIGHGERWIQMVGVLPIAVGKATRWSNSCKMKARSMREKSLWGFSTTTEDASGEVIERTPVEVPLDAEEVDRMIAQMVEKSSRYRLCTTAVKVNGRKLYEYARAGEEVERPVRQVTIYEFTRTSEIGYEEGLARFFFV